MSSQVRYEVDAFGCWVWTGKTDRRDGRPLVWLGQRPLAAHRYVYEQSIGPIPDGLELDHNCRNMSCVRPAHLEPVSRIENERRKRWGYRSKVAKCKAGHDLKGSAIMTPHGGRVCRVCNQLGD